MERMYSFLPPLSGERRIRSEGPAGQFEVVKGPKGLQAENVQVL